MIHQDDAAVTHLYLVRHGETEYNRRHIVQGRGVDIPLNDLGKMQAASLADRSVSFDLDVIYASTLIRARQTAEVVAQRNINLPLIFLKDLEEMSWGAYEGMERTDDLLEKFIQMRDEWRSGNYAFSLGGGESALDVQERGLRALNYIVDKHRGERVMVVAHGRFLRILIASVLQEYGLPRMEEIKHKNTCVNYLTHSVAGYEAHLLNDIDHLASLA